MNDSRHRSTEQKHTNKFKRIKLACLNLQYISYGEFKMRYIDVPSHIQSQNVGRVGRDVCRSWHLKFKLSG